MTLHVWLPAIRAGSGVDVYTRRLARGLERAGVRTTTTWFPHFREVIPWSLPPALPRGAQVVHANSWIGFAFARHPLVVTFHADFLDPNWIRKASRLQAAYYRLLVRRWEQQSFRGARVVTAVSQHLQRILAAQPTAVDSRLIYNWVDTDVFTPQPPPPRKGPFRLLFAGNFSRRKGADLLIEIARRLGDGFEVRFTEGLRPQAVPRHLPPNMQSAGVVDGEDAMARLYASCDALLFPSRSEGFGYAPAEALACARPVICTNSSSLPEIVRDRETGLLCPPDDVPAFVEACRELASDDSRCRRMGEAGRQDVLERFTEPRAIAAYLKVYEEALERPT